MVLRFRLIVSDRPNSSLDAMANPCQSARFRLFQSMAMIQDWLRALGEHGYAWAGPGLSEFIALCLFFFSSSDELKPYGGYT